MLSSHFSQTLSLYISPKSELVVAFSGGVDSVVLLHLAAYYSKLHQLPCVAVYVNHGLSEHAVEWEVFCQSYCDSLGISLFIERVNLDIGPQQSLEEVAREARYDVLAKHINNHSLLLTGQHQDDQVETFFLALKRGSGPAGLSSMPVIAPFVTGRKCRPLLSTSRCDIEAYANVNQLKWVEDESNKDTRFDRNFLRHKVTPLLRQRWPSFASAVNRSAQLCAEQEQLLTELLQPKVKAYQNTIQGISIESLALESEAACKVILRLWLKQFSILLPTQAQLGVLWNEVANAQQDANPCLEINSIQLRRFQGYLYCLPQYGDVSLWNSELKEILTLPDGLGDIELKQTLGANDSDLMPLFLRSPLSGERVTVRFDSTGLIAHPETRQHSRKMKKLYQEYGIPSWQRTRLPLIFYNDQLAAVTGLFVCKAFSGKECELIWHKSGSI